MKLRSIALLIFALFVFVPMTILAQEATPEVTPEPDTALSLLDAVAIVNATYADTFILEIQMDEENACWKVELADGTELCVDALTGEIVLDDMSPEATPEAEMTPEPEATSDPTAPAPVISMEKAVAIALTVFPDGVVSKIELETWDDGSLAWEVKLDNDTRVVEIDATDGTVYDFGYDTNNDDSNDASGDHHDSYNADSSSHDSYDDNDSHDSYDDSSNHDSYEDKSDDSYEDSNHDSHNDDEHDDEHSDDSSSHDSSSDSD